MKSPILTTPNPHLRQKSSKVHIITDEVLSTIDKMIKASLNWEKSHPHELSAAMAAPQIGAPIRAIILRENLDNKSDTTFTALINPEITKLEGKIKKDYEGCLSVPRIYGLVPRHTKVRVKALLADGTPIRIKATDNLARTLQHEIDHLNGTLFIDHIKHDKSAFFELDNKGDLQPLNYEKDIANNPTLWS